MDLKGAIVSAFDRILSDGEIDKMIEDKVARTVASVIDDVLRDYGDFGKQLKEQVRSSLKIDGDLGLPAYNELLLKVIRKQVDNQIGNALQRQVAAQMENLLQTPPETVNLSKIVEEFKKYAQESYSSRGATRFTFGIDDSDTSDGYWDAWFDPEESKREFEAAHRISVDREGRVYSMTVDRQNAEKRLFVGPLYGFERSLFQMKVAGTKIVRDISPDDVDLYYSRECHC